MAFFPCRHSRILGRFIFAQPIIQIDEVVVSALRRCCCGPFGLYSLYSLDRQDTEIAGKPTFGGYGT